MVLRLGFLVRTNSLYTRRLSRIRDKMRAGIGRLLIGMNCLGTDCNCADFRVSANRATWMSTDWGSIVGVMFGRFSVINC
jgi:hypothetical protein